MREMFEYHRKTGGPAFPEPARAHEGFQSMVDDSGMTLRDYFAAQALPAIMEDCATSDAYGHDFSDYARIAFKLADAMIEAREATND